MMDMLFPQEGCAGERPEKGNKKLRGLEDPNYKELQALNLLSLEKTLEEI